MKISKAHKEFASRLYNQEILNHPDLYLGPNWEAVINFWLYLDTLSYGQLHVVYDRWLELNNEEKDISWSKAWDASNAITKYAYDASESALQSGSGLYCAKVAVAYATLELIGSQKLLEQGHELVFFLMFLNP
jgi:hypothetical protein